MRKFWSFRWLCLKEAWRGCWTRANEKGGLLGAGILWLVLVLSSRHLRELGLIDAPTTIWGVAGFTFASAVASVLLAFFVIFFGRLATSSARLWWQEHDARSRAETELAELQLEKSEIQLSLDENDYSVPCFFFEDKPAEVAFFIRVRNTDGHHLERCQIQLTYDPLDGRKMPEYAHFKVCEPFSMRPDEITTAHILYATLDPINDPEKHLCVPALTEVNGRWERAIGTPILMPGETYNITVEALSANTRKSLLKIVAMQHRGRWVLRNATSELARIE